jgi:hypothetical protein
MRSVARRRGILGGFSGNLNGRGTCGDVVVRIEVKMMVKLKPKCREIIVKWNCQNRKARSTRPQFQHHSNEIKRSLHEITEEN